MCVGIPMILVSSDGLHGRGRQHDGTEQDVDLSLVGAQEAGTWMLVHIDTARSIIDAETADQVANALSALTLAMRGESIDHLFADLIGREPQLPEFLREHTDVNIQESKA